MICLELFATFFRIGLFTIGGGYAMLPLIQQEVENRGWMTAEALVNFVAVSESTPGPFAVNISTYVGAELVGFPGAVCSTLGVVMPSFLIILLVARCFAAFQNSSLVRGAMDGLRPAVIGLIGASVFSVGQEVLFPGGVAWVTVATVPFWGSVVVFGLMMVLSRKGVHPIGLIALSAVLGLAAGWGGLL